MEQKSNIAAVKGALIKSSTEECALGMGQRSNNAAVKGAQTMLRREEYAGDTERTAILMMNLLLLHHVLDPNLIRLL
jgi:hypothetical protein